MAADSKPVQEARTLLSLAGLSCYWQPVSNTSQTGTPFQGLLAASKQSRWRPHAIIIVALKSQSLSLVSIERRLHSVTQNGTFGTFIRLDIRPFHELHPHEQLLSCPLQPFSRIYSISCILFLGVTLERSTS